jgi:histidyl-tRNA synthetase
VFIIDTLKSLDTMLLAAELRSLGVGVERAYDGRSMKSQMKLADRSGAVLAILIGEQEAKVGEITVRRLAGAADERRQFRITRAGSAQVILDLLQEMAEQ